MLVSLDLVRAAVALLLPFVTEIWQVYVLIFVLQAASAAFTPTFQATIPDVLPDEKQYTRALSLSRLAYDFESLVSPTLAAALLTVISFHSLFGGTAVGFLVSAALVFSAVLPGPKTSLRRGIYDRTTRGIRIYLATPRLRGLLAVNMAVAAAGAWSSSTRSSRCRPYSASDRARPPWRSRPSAAARCWSHWCCRVSWTALRIASRCWPAL